MFSVGLEVVNYHRLNILEFHSDKSFGYFLWLNYLFEVKYHIYVVIFLF